MGRPKLTLGRANTAAIAAEPAPKAATEHTKTAPGPGADRRVGISIEPTDLAAAKAAYMSDQDYLPQAPPSLARWVTRAVRLHLSRTPAQRARAAEGAPVGEGNKVRYSTTIPIPVHEQLVAAVGQERRAGRATTVSGLIREAIAVEVAAATERAGGRLPKLRGPLPHARG